MTQVINGREKVDVLVNISGQTVATSISGQTVVSVISGQTVVAEVSGQTVVTSISGQTVVTSISGQTVVAEVSGQTVVTSISGQTVVTSISGQTVVAEVSGQTVVTSISGQTVVTTVSGQAVFVYISGGDITAVADIIPYKASGMGSGAIALATVAGQEAYLDYVEYHGNSACTVASSGTEFVVSHNVESGVVIKIYSVDMGVNTVKDLAFYPDAPTVLMSGETVSVAWSNPETVAYYARIITRR